MSLKMDSCPFSFDSLEESELGKALQEGEQCAWKGQTSPLLFHSHPSLTPHLSLSFSEVMLSFFAFCFS